MPARLELARFELAQEECIGCGLCAERAPENLEASSAAGPARLIAQPVSATQEEACFEAAEYCPIGALRAHPSKPQDQDPRRIP